MPQKKNIVGGVVVLGVLALIAGALFTVLGTNTDSEGTPRNQEVSTAEPLDIALDFYNPWLEARQSTTTNPYSEGLATKGILSEQLRTRIIESEGRPEADIDPVLCQTTVPEKVTGRIVSQDEHNVRILVMARDKTLTAQSVFELKRHNDGWFIEDIVCSPGEFAPDREFTFEKEGFLLKSVPPPYTTGNWHLVFEEDGELGHVAPLFFSATSSCIATDTSTSTCAPDQFTEAKKVKTYGQMTELGVEVTKLEFLE